MCAADVVIVIVVEPLNVKVAPAIVLFKGVISKSCPSKNISKNLSVPMATYLLPS